MNFLWANDMKRGLRLVALRAGIILGIAAGAAFLGYVFGRSYGPVRAAPAASASPALCRPANADTREAMAKRNVVWRVWNEDDASVPKSPERAIAAALGMILSPGSSVEVRNQGMRLYLQKSVAYLSTEDIETIQEEMNDGSPTKLADAIRRISAADGEAADLVRAVLADDERVGRFVTHSGAIPLETMPDGSTP